MIVRYGYKTYEEAEKEAKALLWKYRKGDELTTKEHSRLDGDGKRLPFTYIEGKETGATAFIYSLDESENYNLTFLTGEEMNEDNRTYPYRGVSKDALPFLMAIRTPIFKPVREIKPDEALTPDGLKEINFFFGVEEEGSTEYGGFLSEEETESKGYTIETAFDEENALICLPFPQVLTKLTGEEIKTPSDYAKGISILLKAELSEEQERGAKRTFTFYTSDTFLRYAIYEFFRTESYSHLKEILSTYRNFYLPEEWEVEYPLYYGYANVVKGEHFSTEEYILGKYLSKWNANIVGRQARLKDVAEYTGTPLSLMNKAYKIIRIWDF